MKNSIRLLTIEFELNYINVISRKNLREHAAIRLILSALASPEEIRNLRGVDIKKDRSDFRVRLKSAGKSRISPVDEKTYLILKELFKKGDDVFCGIELDGIVAKYSPPGRKYDVSKLKKSVIEILRDCLLIGDRDLVQDLLKGRNIEKVSDFLRDFHPMYSGMWELDDEEAAREFLISYSKYTGIHDVALIAEKIDEDERRILELLK
jgi:integrase